MTGHIAESVTEVHLDRVDWRVLWHFAGPGRHGVDLAFLTPDDKIVAVEVKGTLTAGHIPRLSRREMTQMSAEWVDKADNPGMAELGLRSADIYGAVAVVNFADMTWRIALTSDFSSLSPVIHIGQLTDLNWLAYGDSAGLTSSVVAKPCRLPTTRRAVPDTRLAEINQTAAATGDDPELDAGLLRLHT